MAHRLDGCDERLGRARQHLDDLNIAIQRFLPNSNSVGSKVDYKRRQYTAKAIVRHEPPLAWGVVIGEILYNMRSALDHLVWQLVLENKGRPGTWHQFPIMTSSKDFDREGVGHLAGMTPGAIALVREFQPFDGWQNKAGGIHALWLLDTLCNVDKHRTLNLAQFFVQSVDVIFPEGVVVHRLKKMARRPFKDDAVLLRCGWSGMPKGNPEADVQLKISYDVTFDHSGRHAQIPTDLSGFPVMETLDMTQTFLCASLFPAFLHYFR